MRALPPIDRSKVKTVSARTRASRVNLRDEATPHRAGGSCADFLAGLPNIRGGADLRVAAQAWARAWQDDRSVVWGMGAHLIKVGLAPVVVDLLERGAINALMLNGAGCVHDLELAMMGQTSEDVAEALDDGSFGMARETGTALNEAIAAGAEDGLGMGEAIGREIEQGDYPHKGRSILAAAYRLGVPACVHVAIGTDIHHMHPGADGAALGATSYRDFEKITSVVAMGKTPLVMGLDSGLPIAILTKIDLLSYLSQRR